MQRIVQALPLECYPEDHHLLLGCVVEVALIYINNECVVEAKDKMIRSLTL